MLVTKHQEANSTNLSCHDTLIRPTGLLKSYAHCFCTPEDTEGSKYSH